MNRRAFLRLAGLSTAGLFVPRGILEFPPSVRTAMENGYNFYGLTIDDGWSSAGVDETVDTLLQSRAFGLPDASATFFFVGRLLADRGRQVFDAFGDFRSFDFGYHTMNHPAVEEVVRWSSDDWLRDMDAWVTAGLRAGLGGLLVAFARSPGGVTTDAFLEACATFDTPLMPVGWSTEPYDWHRGRILIDSGRIALAHARHSDVGILAQALLIAHAFHRVPVNLPRLWTAHKVYRRACDESWGGSAAFCPYLNPK